MHCSILSAKKDVDHVEHWCKLQTFEMVGYIRFRFIHLIFDMKHIYPECQSISIASTYSFTNTNHGALKWEKR